MPDKDSPPIDLDEWELMKTGDVLRDDVVRVSKYGAVQLLRLGDPLDRDFMPSDRVYRRKGRADD